MKKYFFPMMISLLLFSLVGCTSSKIIVRENLINTLPTPSLDKAMVVFMRPSLIGKPALTTLFDGERMISVLQGKHSFFYETNPGKHVFSCLSESMDSFFTFLEADLAPGKMYYVYLDVSSSRIGNLRGYLTPLKPSAENQIKKDEFIASTTPVEPSEEAYKWFEKYSSELLRKQTIWLEKYISNYKDKPDEKPVIHIDDTM